MEATVTEIIWLKSTAIGALLSQHHSSYFRPTKAQSFLPNYHLGQGDPTAGL